jgi:hypothetical protein
MKMNQLFHCVFALSLITLLLACAPVKTIEVWKSETYSEKPQKILVIAVVPSINIRKQVENVLYNELVKFGLEVSVNHKLFPDAAAELTKEDVVAKVRELQVDSVLVVSAIGKKEITNHQYGGVFMGGVAIYDNGWYGASYGYFYSREYDTDSFTISSKLYDVNKSRPVWSYISQVRVEGSRQKAVNQLVPTIVKELETSQLI